MNVRWRHEWATVKCGMVRRLLEEDQGDFTYAEATILLTAMLSALSAEAWPGKQSLNRVRFVELMVRLGKHQDLSAHVSVPLVIHHLEDIGRQDLATALGRHFGVPRSALVVDGSQCDAPLLKVAGVVPQVDIKVLRKFSYANLLYGEVRTAYAHDYGAGEKAASRAMVRGLTSGVSYVNRIDDDSPYQMRRLIHFHVEWILDLVLDLSQALDQAATVPLMAPAVWWLDES